MLGRHTAVQTKPANISATLVVQTLSHIPCCQVVVNDNGAQVVIIAGQNRSHLGSGATTLHDVGNASLVEQLNGSLVSANTDAAVIVIHQRSLDCGHSFVAAETGFQEGELYVQRRSQVFQSGLVLGAQLIGELCIDDQNLEGGQFLVGGNFIGSIVFGSNLAASIDGGTSLLSFGLGSFWLGSFGIRSCRCSLTTGDHGNDHDQS